MRKYESLVRFGKRGTDKIFKTGEMLVVEEKLDGANASMQVVDGVVKAYSRNNELDAMNTLRGFYQYAQGFADKLYEGFIYYGEWLVPHTINYPEEHQKKFYLFDVYDIKQEKYLPASAVVDFAYEADLLLVPVLGTAYFSSIGEVMQFVGKSKLAEKGEGVVLKYFNSEDREVVKIVSDEFKEMKGLPKQKVSSSSDSLHEFVSATVTPARIEKLLNKLVDEGVIPEDYDLQEMPIILKNMGSAVYEDIMKEEADVLHKLVKQKIGKVTPSIIKQVITQRSAF